MVFLFLFFSKQNVVAYSYHCLGRACVRALQCTSRTMARFLVVCGMRCLTCSVPLFLSLWGYWVWHCQKRSKKSPSFVLFSSAFRSMFPFLSSVQIGAQMQSREPPSLLSLLGLWETEERRNSNAQLFIKPLLVPYMTFFPYLLSTLWRWWQPHPAELPDSWGAWSDAHTSLLLLYLLCGARTSTKGEDGGDHHLTHHTEGSTGW